MPLPSIRRYTISVLRTTKFQILQPSVNFEPTRIETLQTQNKRLDPGNGISAKAFDEQESAFALPCRLSYKPAPLVVNIHTTSVV